MNSRHSGERSPLYLGWVSPAWPAGAMANGIVSYTTTIVSALQDLGARCHVFTSRPSDQKLEEFIHITGITRTPGLSPLMRRLAPQTWPHRSFCTALLREVRRVHAQEGLELLELEESFGWARWLAGKSPVPLVLRLHGPWFLNGAANGAVPDKAFHQRVRWEGEGLRLAQAVTAPSRHVLEETRRHYGLDLPDARVIPNPVQAVALQDRWNLGNCDSNRIAFVGRFDRHKGGDTMVEAFGRIIYQNPEARLDFIGPDRGYIDNIGRIWRFDAYLRHVLGEAEQRNVTYHGFQPLSAAAELRKRALVTVAPSRYETFGLAAAEAMMAGCPLVVCDGGALTELVQDGRNGLVARAEDADDVAAKVLSLLNDPPRAAQLGAQAAEDAAQRYAPHMVGRMMLDQYRDVLGQPREQPTMSGSAPAT